MKIKIILKPTFSVAWPKIKIQINEREFFNNFCQPNDKKYFVWYEEVPNLLEENLLKITHFDKKGNDSILDSEGNIEKDRAIILKSIEFDGITVPEVLLYNEKFYPDWPGQPEFVTNNLYFGFNGTYVYQFQNNSKLMYYQNLLKKEMLANINNKKTIILPSGEEVESFEFNGKFIDGSKKDNTTIDDLHKLVTNEN